MNIEMLETKIYKALAHPTRLELVKKLSKSNRCVCELFDESESSQPNISQHLKILRDADIVSYKKESNKLIYSIKHLEVLEIIHLARGIIESEINDLTAK